MGESSGQYQKLPPGWDCKYDQATGNCYYINYLTKAMQLEDPRMRYIQLQNERCSTESIPMQPMHGSPYHVYPSNNYPAVRAFQGPTQNQASLNNMSSSPLLSSTKSHMEMSPIPLTKSSAPQTPHRLVNMSRRSTIQETSFSNQINTDAVVNKIQNMFPTAGENHIRLLLRRYMKNIFPKADEMLLLDVLASADNNVQIASEKLIAMGYVKRDFVPPKVNNRPELDVHGRVKKPGDEKIIPLRPKEYSEQEKESMKIRLKEKYNQIAENVIIMALESVNYSEDRATQILQIVQEEDETREKKATSELENALNQLNNMTTDGCIESITSTGAAEKNSPRDSTEEDTDLVQNQEFKSLLGRIATIGQNVDLAKGPNDSILLADYVTWNGANPDISVGQKQTAAGSDIALLSERNYLATGRNPELCKGPKVGLANGSIYAQLKCN